MASSDTRWLTEGEPAHCSCSIEVDSGSTGSLTGAFSTKIEVDAGSTGSSTGAFLTKIEVDAGSTRASSTVFVETAVSATARGCQLGNRTADDMIAILGLLKKKQFQYLYFNNNF